MSHAAPRGRPPSPTEGRPDPSLIAITDRRVASAAATLERFARLGRVAAPGSVLFQLRDRELPAPERLAFGRELRAVASETGQWLQVNDRLDLALLLGADALHLGEVSVTAEDARRLAGAATFISRALHDPEQRLDAAVDAWVLSPVAAARKGRPALGFGAVRRVAERCRTASGGADQAGRAVVFALGGITPDGAREAVRAGARGVAVIGAVLGGEDPEALLAALGALRAP